MNISLWKAVAQRSAISLKTFTIFLSDFQHSKFFLCSQFQLHFWLLSITASLPINKTLCHNEKLKGASYAATTLWRCVNETK